LQAFIKEYLINPITQQDIDTAEAIITAHGEPFNKEGWEYILKTYGGRLPVVIKAAQEGCIIPTKNVLVTIENTDPKCYWLTSFLETALLRAVWYPTTVATNRYESKKLITQYLEKNGDPSLIDFKLHDFSARGVSSLESAGLSASAHLINFMGTDTVTGLLYAREYYGADMAGYSIPAMEHSTVTSWGRDGEEASFRNMIKQNSKPGGLFACVSDSYDIYKACELWGTKLKDDVINSGATLVVRPDSGSPSEVVANCLRILDKYFGHTINSKGYRVLNNVRIIQGDGINHSSIRSILFVADLNGYSADNIAFGQGGALAQIVNRDTMRFAQKCSAIGIRIPVKQEGKNVIDSTIEWHDVFKDPVTDQGKTSKKGRVTLWKCGSEYMTSVAKPTNNVDNGSVWEEALEPVFKNGELLRDMTFDQVRANSRL
jgi:nicotinamide phosphoribosyltransferase